MISRMRSWLLGSPSLQMLGYEPTLDWVITGKLDDAARVYPTQHIEMLKRALHEAWEENAKLRDKQRRTHVFWDTRLAGIRVAIQSMSVRLAGLVTLNTNNAKVHPEFLERLQSAARAAAYRQAYDIFKAWALEHGVDVPHDQWDTIKLAGIVVGVDPASRHGDHAATATVKREGDGWRVVSFDILPGSYHNCAKPCGTAGCGGVTERPHRAVDAKPITGRIVVTFGDTTFISAEVIDCQLDRGIRGPGEYTVTARILVNSNDPPKFVHFGETGYRVTACGLQTDEMLLGQLCQATSTTLGGGAIVVATLASKVTCPVCRRKAGFMTEPKTRTPGRVAFSAADPHGIEQRAGRLAADRADDAARRAVDEAMGVSDPKPATTQPLIFCPHGCGHRLVDLWDYDWRKGEQITECPKCHKPVDMRIKYIVERGR